MESGGQAQTKEPPLRMGAGLDGPGPGRVTRSSGATQWARSPVRRRPRGQSRGVGRCAGGEARGGGLGRG